MKMNADPEIRNAFHSEFGMRKQVNRLMVDGGQAKGRRPKAIRKSLQSTLFSTPLRGNHLKERKPKNETNKTNCL